MRTIADQFRCDPRVQQAHELLKTALREHQSKITAVQRGSGDRAWVERAEQARGMPLFHPYIGSGIGNGCYVELADGRVVLDFIGGVGVHPGHSLPGLIDTVCHNTVQQGNLQQNREAIELMEQLCKRSGFDHCFLSTSGAMACENALKIAFQKRAPRSRILAFERGFSGRTLALSWVTDNPTYREGLPETVQVDHIPFGDLQRLDELLAQNEYAAMVLELVQGESGVNTADAEYFQQLAARLNRRDILVIADEVQTFGRTAKLFAFQHFGITPDIVTIGKLAQVCATLYNKELVPRLGLLSQTFISTGVAIRAALHILEELQPSRNQQIHDYFVAKLKKLGLPGPYGCGLMVAFTYDDALNFVHRLFEEGLLCFIAGPKRVRMLPPPLAVDEAAIDAAMEVIARCL